MVRATTLEARWKKNKFNISEDERIQEFNPVNLELQSVPVAARSKA